MLSLSCPVCGHGNSEFDASCAACGAPLPAGPEAVPPPAADPLVGQRISHFEVLAPLGRGGMGVVYRALDRELVREVALKFPARAGSLQEEARFLHEARTAAALDHPNIGTIYEVGEHQGRRFLAMALYEGETLDRRLERIGRLPAAEAASIAGQLAAALAAAHDAGIVHRDLKPANVLLTRDGRVKLLDFGTAWQTGAPHLTAPGHAMGTAAYMAPEQLRGDPCGPAADLWALGVVLYEMLAGRHPFGGERRGMVHAVLYEDPPPLRDVSPVLARTVERCLAKEPAARPGSAAEILDDLRQAGLLGFGSDAAAVLPATSRRKIWLWGGLAAALPLLGVALYLLRPAPPPLVRIAVLDPQVTGSAPAEDLTRAATNLRTAVLRTLAALDGVAAIDPAQLGTAGGNPREPREPREIARAVAAQEVFRSRAECRGDLCQVSLQRLNGAEGTVVWTETLALSLDAPRLSAEAVAARVRDGFPGRGLRLPGLELRATETDYADYLDLLQELTRGRRPTEEDLKRLTGLRQRAPDFLEVYFLESSVARTLYAIHADPRDLEHSLEVARLAERKAPGDPRPAASLFDALLDAGRIDEAEKVLTGMQNLPFSVPDLLLRQARLAERRGDAPGAMALMTRLVADQPSWQYLLLLAHMESRGGRLDDARRHLRQLLDRAPGNLQGLAMLAELELLSGSPDRAIALFREQARRAPGTQARTNLGVALLLTRRYAEAETALREALTAEPGNPQVALNLADCRWLLGDRGEARRLYRQVVAAVGGDASIPWQLRSTKAQALAHLGEGDAALEVLQDMLRQMPDNPQLAFEASLVHVLAGDRASALLQARRAVEKGIHPAWFRFPWFDPLRADPAFVRLTVLPRPHS